MRTLSPVLALLLSVGCTLGSETDGTLTPGDAFEEAELRTGVPADLLVAIARAETGLHMVQGHEEFEGQAPAHGIMALRGANLEAGAALAGVTVDQAMTELDANVLAAAALLASWADEEGIDTGELGAWGGIVARYSGIEREDAAAEYVHFDVFGALNTGIEADGISVAPVDVLADYPMPTFDTLRGGDADAIWTPSPNYNSRNGAEAEFIIIHTCEGSYAGCWSWLVNPASGVSAHYVVNDDGSEVRWLVDEDDRAWHIAANYDCANNFNVECWRNGTSMNTISVGLEHAGFSDQPSWDNGLIQRSAELSCGITQRNPIPRDSYHIVGHGQLQPWNRYDPGPNWPWADYLNRIQVACGGGNPGGPERLIDDDNVNNNMSLYGFQPGSGWWESVNVPGYQGNGYHVAPTEAISDPATFWFKNHTNSSKCIQVEAWWTAAFDRAPAATYIAWDPSAAEVGRATVNQQVNGSQWNYLGEWNFPPGWNRILLSRWTTPGYYVVADSVRLTLGSNCN